MCTTVGKLFLLLLAVSHIPVDATIHCKSPNALFDQAANLQGCGKQEYTGVFASTSVGGPTVTFLNTVSRPFSQV